MVLDSQKWYVRLYFWSLEILEEFLDNGYDWRHNSGTNLCHFLRVILIYMPAVVLINLSIVVSAFYVLTLWPIHLFGFWSYVWSIAAIAALSGLIWLYVRKKRKELARPKTQMAKKMEGKDSPTFTRLVWEGVKSTKRKVCPILSFSENKETEVGR